MREKSAKAGNARKHCNDAQHDVGHVDDVEHRVEHRARSSC